MEIDSLPSGFFEGEPVSFQDLLIDLFLLDVFVAIQHV